MNLRFMLKCSEDLLSIRDRKLAVVEAVSLRLLMGGRR